MRKIKSKLFPELGKDQSLWKHIFDKHEYFLIWLSIILSLSAIVISLSTTVWPPINKPNLDIISITTNGSMSFYIHNGGNAPCLGLKIKSSFLVYDLYFEHNDNNTVYLEKKCENRIYPLPWANEVVEFPVKQCIFYYDSLDTGKYLRVYAAFDQYTSDMIDIQEVGLVPTKSTVVKAKCANDYWFTRAKGEVSTPGWRGEVDEENYQERFFEKISRVSHQIIGALIFTFNIS